MTLTTTISGTPVSLLASTNPRVHDTLDQRSTASFLVRDTTGAVHFSYGAPVVITDSVAGEMFRGFIQDSTEQNMPPNPDNTILINCFDERYLADKRVASGANDDANMSNKDAGDNVVYLLANYLAQEGVTASYATRSDTTQADFQVGVLSGVAATSNLGDGDLELATAGQDTSSSFASTGDFFLGTFTSVDVGNSGQVANQVNLSAYSGLKFTATNIGNLGNTYAYWEIYNDGSTTIASGDTLRYDVWIASTSPQIMAAVDVVFTDGFTLRDFNSQSAVDQNYLHAHPNADLNGFANDQWYHRQIAFPTTGGAGNTGVVGKTIAFVSVAFEGDTAGDYTAYFRNIFIWNSTPAVKVTVLNSAITPYQASLLSVSQNYLLGSNGYSNVAAVMTTVYDQNGTWVSPAISIDQAKIVKGSLVSWQSLIPAGIAAATQVTSSAAPLTPVGTTLTVSSSIDDQGTWQPATFNQAMPNLLPGFVVSGRNCYLKAIFAITGTTPEISPILSRIQSTVTSSWQQTKTDSLTIARTQGNFNTGNYTNSAWYSAPNGANTSLFPSGDTGVALNGYWEGWDRADGTIQNTTTYSGASPNVYTNARQLNIFCNTTNNDVRVKQNNAPSLANFTAQISIAVREHVDLENGCGIVYRTTNWGSANNTFAYTAMLVFNAGHGATPQNPYTASLQLGRGVNSNTSPAYTSLANVLLPFVPAANTYYTIKVVVNGSTHQVYLDDVLFITVTDNTFSGAGGFGVRYYDNMGVGGTGIFDNFGVVAALSGTWDNGAGIALGSGLGSMGNALIAWDADVPGGTSILVQTSTDGGSTWQTASSGGGIASLPAQSFTPGKHVKVKVTLASTYPSVTPILKGLVVWLTTATNILNSRVSPALNLSSVGRAGSTSVTWNGVEPTNARLLVDTSIDGVNWLNIGSGASGSQPVAGIDVQADPIEDTFDANTSSFYTSTFQTGGSIATWDFSAATPSTSHITASSGARALLLYSSLIADDLDLVTDMDTSDAGGLVWRFVDSSNFYDLVVCDASSPTPGVVTLSKVATNVRTALATGSVTWTRTTPHRIRMTMLGPLITVTFDGAAVLSYSDNFPLASGTCGLRSDTVSGASAANFYFFRALALGDSVLNTLVFTRTRLATTDPTVTPQLTDITTSVRSPDIGNGAFIPSTTYSVLNGSTNTIAADFDDMAKQSNYWWKIKDGALKFQAHNATLAPFIITPADMLIGVGPVTVKRDGSLFRTVPWILGGTDTLPYSQTFETDGLSQTYTLDYPVQDISSISDGTRTYSYGIKGVDTGKDFYFQVGNNTINQDASESLLPANLDLTFSYDGQVNAVASAQNAGLIASQAALESTSGLIEVPETAPGLNRAAAAQLAASRETMYGTPATTVQFPTARTGLAVGQLLSVFLPQHKLVDWTGLITDIQIFWRKDMGVPNRGSIDATPYFTVTAVDGPILNSWASTLSGMGR